MSTFKDSMVNITKHTRVLSPGTRAAVRLRRHSTQCAKIKGMHLPRIYLVSNFHALIDKNNISTSAFKIQATILAKKKTTAFP